MQRYLDQLLGDLAHATENVSFPYLDKTLHLEGWITDEEEDNTAPVRNLQVWTGINAEMLPPEGMLSGEQVRAILEALKKMLDAYNCSFVMQITVPERVQYETIRRNLDQEVRVKQWHMGFFELCPPGTRHKTCALGEWCHCHFFAEMFSQFEDEELTPEEERARLLQIEIKHLKRKYEDDWMRYYPYHLDAAYDDEDGNPYNYGAGDFDEDE